MALSIKIVEARFVRISQGPYISENLNTKTKNIVLRSISFL